eukprot:7225199-Alexandrium_andersonii.AAC.1
MAVILPVRSFSLCEDSRKRVPTSPSGLVGRPRGPSVGHFSRALSQCGGTHSCAASGISALALGMSRCVRRSPRAAVHLH